MIILITIVIFSAVVIVHELGHFWAARIAGVEVEEFGIGFPPRATGLKRGRTLYSINWLPLGGFVRLRGEDSGQTGPGSFGAASIKQKAFILLAGVGMNLVMAYGILVVLALTGLPQLVDGQINLGHYHNTQGVVIVADVVKDSPAAAAGLSVGTKIISANGQPITSEAELVNFTKAHAGQTVALVVDQNYVTKEVDLKLNQTAGTTGYLGVQPLKLTTRQFGLWAPVEAFALLLQLIWKALAGVGALLLYLVGVFTRHQTPVTSQAVQGVAGPIGIVVILNNALHLGWTYLLVIVLSITLTLGVVNALPIPALDGGRMLFTLTRRFTKWPSTKLEARINGVSFSLLLLLIAVISVFDVRRFF